MPIYEISIWIDAMHIYLERGKTREGRWKPWLSAELQGRSFIPVCNGHLNRSSNDLITVCPFSCIPTDFQPLHCPLNDQFLVSPPPPQLFQVSFSFASLQNISSMDRNSWFLWTYIIYFTSCTTQSCGSISTYITTSRTDCNTKIYSFNMTQYPNIQVLQNSTLAFSTALHYTYAALFSF